MPPATRQSDLFHQGVKSAKQAVNMLMTSCSHLNQTSNVVDASCQNHILVQACDPCHEHEQTLANKHSQHIPISVRFKICVGVIYYSHGGSSSSFIEAKEVHKFCLDAKSRNTMTWQPNVTITTKLFALHAYLGTRRILGTLMPGWATLRLVCCTSSVTGHSDLISPLLEYCLIAPHMCVHTKFVWAQDCKLMVSILNDPDGQRGCPKELQLSWLLLCPVSVKSHLEV